MSTQRPWFARTIAIARIVVLLVTGYLLVRVAWPFMNPQSRDASVQRWCRSVLRAIGVDLATSGRELPARGGQGVLLIANHVSWVDAVAIHALMPCGFLAKASLRAWPIVGSLIERTGGVFVQRGNPFDLDRVLGTMNEALASGRSVCVFPEGTTTDGGAVLPFSTLVFELAARHGAKMVPMGVRYLQDGAASRIPAWVGDEAFLPSLFRIVASRGLKVEVMVGSRLEPVPERQRAAEHAREAVALLLGVPLAPGDGAAASDVGTVPDARAVEIAAAVRAWIAVERKLDSPQVADRASLRSLGIDSLSILRIVVELEQRLGLRVDESKLDLSSRATVLELSAAVASAER